MVNLPTIAPAVFQWGPLSILAAVLIWWIRGIPQRLEAKIKSRAQNATEMERLLVDYAAQVALCRKEIHDLRGEMAKVQAQLHNSDKTSQQRSERISTMELIIELLITELERLDPTSIIVRQAKMMLRRVSSGGDPNKSQEMNSAVNAVTDAKQTVASAERTVTDLSATEARAANKK